MYVVMHKTIGTVGELFKAGQVYDVGPAQAARWEREGKATRTCETTEAVKKIQARLDYGAGKPCVFLPPAGMEFGHEVMTHLRIVHFHKASRKVVCCRPGNEVLYPDGDEFFTEWSDPVPDEYRVGSKLTPREWPAIAERFPGHVLVPAGGFTNEEALCAVRPQTRIMFTARMRGLKADIVLGVRSRKFWTARNWKHWQELANLITAHGYTFAVMGARETSLDLTGQAYHTGDLGTDAAVELLYQCRLYIGTDCGASHLASTVGCPMLLFREHVSGSPDLIPRMRMVNPYPVSVVPDGWESPAAVWSAATPILASNK